MRGSWPRVIGLGRSARRLIRLFRPALFVEFGLCLTLGLGGLGGDLAVLGGRLGGYCGPGGNWLVISPEGAEVGWLEMPEGLEPVQITSDAVVGIYRDELGVESVRVHSLSRH